MNRFWNSLIRPIIEEIGAKYIVEIGSESGINTKNILEYCQSHDARMSTIDPAPLFDVDKCKKEYGNKFEIHEGLSLSILPLLTDYDVVLIDGDHNWYTVYNELKIIEKTFKGKKFPIVFLHDVGWPYARRDLYYNPSNIPEAYRQPYKKLGLYPGLKDLKDKGGLNSNHNNSIYENNLKNGVLTALEDFVGESNLDFSFKIIDGFHGLGILYPKNYVIRDIVEKNVKKADLSRLIEFERIKLVIKYFELIDQTNVFKKGLNETKTKLKNVQNQYNKTKDRLICTNNLLKEKNVLLGDLEDRLVRVEGDLRSSEGFVKMKENELRLSQETIKEKNSLITKMEKREKQIGELNSQLNSLTSNLYEMNYRSSKGRPLLQKFISTFPSLYILFNLKKTGIKSALINLKGYNAIKKKNIFDLGYYLKNNEDVRISGVDPILHYIYYGFKENRNPNSYFDTNYYLNSYPDVKKADCNPLVHYVLYGIGEGRTFKKKNKMQKLTENKKDKTNSSDNVKNFRNEKKFSNSLDSFNKVKKYSSDQIDDIMGALTSNKKITIIIPIFNAFEDTKNCIESVLKHTRIPHEILLIDDNSSDNRIGKLLDETGKLVNNVKVIRNTKNRGFVKNVNLGIRNSTGDIVLLNSDTIVTPKWLQKLVVTAYSNKKIATVTPLSNAAGAFSVPEIGKNNEIDDDLKIEGMANLVEKVSSKVNLEVPTGNGFCMFIKRNAIYDIGVFDEINFDRGYGEENDFCMRLNDKGWSNVIDDSTYIYHKRSASFFNNDPEIVKIKKKNRAMVDKKHPTYTQKTREFVYSNEYNKIGESIKDALSNKDINNFKRKRILYVIHEGHGGTPHTNDDLMSHIQNGMDCFLLSSNSEEVILWEYRGNLENYKSKTNQKQNNSEYIFHKEFRNNLKQICSWKIKSKYSSRKFFNSEFKNIYFNVLTEFNIDIVHIRHLIKHTFDLPIVAHDLGLPIILSFHDFYFICPSHLLLDENNVYCDGVCTEGYGQCFLGNAINDFPILKIFVEEWRSVINEILFKCSAFVTTSEITKQLYISIYPELSEMDFRVIEHGRDLVPPENTSEILEIPSSNKPIKILFPGNINIAKGGELIKEIKNEDKNSRLEFHFMGALQSSLNLQDYGMYHGRYKRSDFCKIVKKVRPSFIGILSINPETYVHTLSEAWSCGIPVLATKIGVLEERINKNGGGWFLDFDASAAYSEILRIANSPEEYIDVANKIKNITLKSTKEMSNEYLELYLKFLV